MQTGRFYCGLIWTICWLLQDATTIYVNLSHDGPVVLGGIITFRADLYEGYNERPSGRFEYMWKDNTLNPQHYKTGPTSNTTSYWTISYSRENNVAGWYEVEVTATRKLFFHRTETTRRAISFEVTALLNGNVTLQQSNKTVESVYVSSTAETKSMINLRKGDYDFLMQNATSILTYWFIDCKPYGQTSDFTFPYNFTNANESHVIEALVIASYDPPITTTLPPTTTTQISTTTTSDSSPVVNPNTTTINGSNITTTPTIPTAIATTATTTTITPISTTSILGLKSTTLLPNTVVQSNINATNTSKNSIPYICLNSTLIPSDPNKTYGYFHRKISVRAPITNITVEGTNWIQPWDMLSLNVTCKGSGPFYKCLQFHRGKYNVTGNETCANGDHLHTCNFSIIHYFLEPSVNTIIVILTNDVSKQVSPLTINIYKATTKPQLSVIVVPVSCTLVAVVLVVFGIAYYIQSRARFTIEVADFDFGQNNPEMEYKTFMERLRDSFNNAGYKPLNNPETIQ